MSDVAVKAKLREFLQKSVVSVEIGEDDDIFERGFVNSIFAMELLTFMEQEWGIALEGDDLDIDNFATISNLSRLIVSKNGSQGARDDAA